MKKALSVSVKHCRIQVLGTFPKAFPQGPSTAARKGCGPNAVAKKDLGSCRWEIAHLRSCTLG